MRLWHETFGQAQSKLQLAGWLPAFAFPVLALVVDKTASTVFAIFFLAGLWLLLRGRIERPDPAMRRVLIAFAAYFLVGVASFFLGEQTRLGEQLLGRDIRFLGAVAAYFAFARLALPERLLRFSLAAGGIVAGAVAAVQIMLAEYAGYRAGGETISIVFGHLAAALAVVLIALAVRGRGGDRMLMCAGAVGALLAVVLSGTRGALLTVALIGGLIFIFVPWSGGRWKRAAVAGAIGIGILAMTLLADPARFRFAEGKLELERYLALSERFENAAWPESLPACVNHPALLDWIAAGAIRSHAQVEVMRDAAHPPRAGALDCPANAFLRFSAADRRGAVSLPERSAPPEAAGGDLLVRGTAELRLAGNEDRAVPVASAQWQRVSLHGDAQSGQFSGRYQIILPAGAHLDVAPVAGFAGEYRFAPFNTSVGSRLQMWRAAGAAFVENPAVGQGTGAFPAVLAKRAAAGENSWEIAQYDHAHNELLTVAADRGLIGLLALLAVYAAPFALFYRRRRDACGMAGMALVGAFAVSGLTETVFNHSLAITYYCVLVLLLALAPRPAE